MANRQALRELQSRLASRLQAARDEDSGAAWLAAEAAGRGWLFPLAQAGEIFSWTAPQPVPFTRSWFLGVANLRGSLAGVVDLAAFAGLRTVPAAPPSDASLLSLNPLLGLPCALVLERLAGLRGGSDFVAVQDRADDAPAWFGGRYTDARQGCWQEIDLQALAASAPFLDIASGPAG